MRSIILLITIIAALTSCRTYENEQLVAATDGQNKHTKSAISCTQQAEQTDYSIYYMHSDGSRVGDVMPYYDAASSKFYAFYLKNIWNDATNERHPWHRATTTNFSTYTSITNAAINCSTDGCKQDFALGTGCVIKKSSTYYGFYTGFNPNYPSACVTHKEGIMLATTTNLNNTFTKNTSFATIYAPTGQGFDEQDNWRDPFVYYNSADAKYYMIMAARKNVNGTWRGVIPYYTSTNLTSWTYQGVLYDGGSKNFFMMECPELFKQGSYYYLLFSDMDSKYVYYRKSTSLLGPWSEPTGYSRFVGKGTYAARTATDNTDRYLFGWTNVKVGNTDDGAADWGGNMVVHKFIQLPNGDLKLTIPHTLENYLFAHTDSIYKDSQWGAVSNTIVGTHSYNLISNADNDIANVLFEPIALDKYIITADVSFSSSSKDFGFILGACDGWNQFYSLRFVPSQNRFSFDRTPRTLLTSTTVADDDAPITLTANTTYNMRIVVENSMVVIYVNNEVAMAERIYKATNMHWGIFVDHSNATFSNIKLRRP